MNKSYTSRRNNALTFFLLLVWIVLITLAVVQRQSIADWFALRSYDPPKAIAQYARQDSMTDEAKKIFYVNHPAINAKSAFRKNCERTEKTIVVGCYHSGQNGIFILDINDSRLEGIEQVTAAHEMLHAAYDRLGAKEKNQVNQMLKNYSRVIKDQRILDTLESYEKSEPEDVVNEMHSIFATEISDLLQQLEQYYQQYFIDRSRVVQLSQDYKQAFIARENQIKAYDKQLKLLKSRINNQLASLKQLESNLYEEKAKLERYKQNKQFEQYNAGVGSYNQLVTDYNSLAESTENIIARFNGLVKKRNLLVLEEQQLKNAIQGKDLSPINQQ